MTRALQTPAASPTCTSAQGRDVVKIAIVTPTLNAARFLADCLASVQKQQSDLVTCQHLILDGGSTDGTLEIANAYPVTRIPRQSHMGLVEALCLGFESAESDLIGFLGADDLLLPGALQHVAETYRREKRPVLFCRTRWADAELNPLGELAPPPQRWSAAEHACLGWCYLNASSVFITPAIYRQLGGFDRTITRSIDYDFFTRVLHQKIPFSRVNRPISIYRRHANNDSANQDNRYWNDFTEIQRRFAPPSPWQRRWLSLRAKLWVYGRNPNWAYHQLRRKFLSGRLLG